MSRFRVLPFLALGCFVWLSAIPARADGLPFLLPPAYSVSGALLIVGEDNACGGLPCTETVAFSFDVGYQFLDSNLYRAYATNMVDSWSGALGSFTKSQAGPIFPGIVTGVTGVCAGGGGDANFLAFGDPAGDEIDIHLCQGFASTPVAPSIRAADLYGCATTTCVNDFVPLDRGQTTTLPQLGLFLFGPVEFRVTTTPEPATITLLVSGILLLGLGGAASRKF
jgi:hypothetical protein